MTFGFAAPAFAQQQPSPPTYATTRSNASLSAVPAGGERYTDMGSDKNLGFILEQRGSIVLLQQDGRKEIITLVPMPGARGDTIFQDPTGRVVLKVTSGGNVVSYLNNPTGAPADFVARTPPLSAAGMTASLDSLRMQTATDLSKLAGHEVTIFGTQAFSANEAWAADALSSLVMGVKSANGYAGRSASKLDKVTIIPSKTARVTFKDGELKLELNPNDGLAGRVTPEEISTALTAARSTG